MKLKLTTKSQIEKRPALTTVAMLLLMKITTSCPNNAKPNVGSSTSRHPNQYLCIGNHQLKRSKQRNPNIFQQLLNG